MTCNAFEGNIKPCSLMRIQPSRIEIRRNSFTVRVVKPWNSLPEEVIMAPHLNLDLISFGIISLCYSTTKKSYVSNLTIWAQTTTSCVQTTPMMMMMMMMCYREHQNRSRGTTSLLLSRPQLMQLTIQSYCAISIRAQLYFALSARTDNHIMPRP